MRRPHSALWNSVTWSWKIKIFPFASPWWSQLFSTDTGHILHFTKTHQLYLYFLTSSHRERVSFQISCWETALSTRTLWHRVVIMLPSFSSTHKHHHQPYWPSTKLSIQWIGRHTCVHVCLTWLCAVCFVLCMGGVGQSLCSCNMGSLFSQCDEHHLTVPCLSILSIWAHLQPAHSLYCHSLMAALWSVCWGRMKGGVGAGEV